MESNDRAAFAARLALAMRRLMPPVEGPTALANALAHHFSEGLSVQTTHKWLSGRAIPTKDKIEILAQWLDVSPHWLKYGPDISTRDNKKNRAADLKNLDSATYALADRIRNLPTNQRILVEAMIAEFERL